MKRFHLSVLMLVTGLIWLGLLFFSGVAVELTWLRHIPSVVSILLVLVAAYDLWLWRLPILRRRIARRPLLRGTWRTLIQPTQDTGKYREPVRGYMAIGQTYSRLTLRLLTEESTSESLAAHITSSREGLFSVLVVYRNEPRPSVRKRSPIHYGALILQSADGVTEIAGQYWTDRRSVGELTLSGRHPAYASDYTTAKALFDDE